MKKTSESLTLHHLLILKLQALYDMETELTKTLPIIGKKAFHRKLKSILSSHFSETKHHVERIEKAFEILKEKPKKIKVEAIRGLRKDTDWLLEQIPSMEAIDVSITGAAAYIEHYEIAGYTTAREWASLLGYGEVSELLTQTLMEETATEEKLRTLAISEINRLAIS